MMLSTVFIVNFEHILHIYPLLATGFFLYLLKISEKPGLLMISRDQRHEIRSSTVFTVDFEDVFI